MSDADAPLSATPKSDYIPTTEQIGMAAGGVWGTAEFDRWLESVKAKAWDEGFNEGHYLPNESRECDCRNNPYRTDEQ